MLFEQALRQGRDLAPPVRSGEAFAVAPIGWIRLSLEGMDFHQHFLEPGGLGLRDPFEETVFENVGSHWIQNAGCSENVTGVSEGNRLAKGPA